MGGGLILRENTNCGPHHLMVDSPLQTRLEIAGRTMLTFIDAKRLKEKTMNHAITSRKCIKTSVLKPGMKNLMNNLMRVDSLEKSNSSLCDICYMWYVVKDTW